MIEEVAMERKADSRPARTAHRGHRHVAGNTVVARLIRQRGLKKRHLSIALECSERHLTRFFTRQYPIPRHRLQYLEDLFDMDLDELVDARGYLRLDE